MNRRIDLLGSLALSVAVLSQLAVAAPHIGIQEYAAVMDDVAKKAKAYGQVVVLRAFDVELRNVVKQVPIFSVQYAGGHHMEGARDDPNRVEARAKCIAERLAHAWTLLDHGGELRIAADDWRTWRLGRRGETQTHKAIYVRSPAARQEPLRIMTIYPEDVTGYPWVTTEESLAEYITTLIRAHYLLFWKNEIDISQYEALRIDGTREGKIFKEIAVRALEMAKLKEQQRLDDEVLRDALARIALPQRERLYRLAMTPPPDWESSPR
ncbi:MAG: hypothetical protein JSU70_09400 [Phycisphaerales bacterium]|nr:MAG: hypothetical protein JSU70_09400 [Phycisphaerales bacterium]